MSGGLIDQHSIVRVTAQNIQKYAVDKHRKYTDAADSSIRVWSSHWLGYPWRCSRVIWWRVGLGHCTAPERLTEWRVYLGHCTVPARLTEWPVGLGHCTVPERLYRSPLHFQPLWYHLASTLPKEPQTTKDKMQDATLLQNYAKHPKPLRTEQSILYLFNTTKRTSHHWRSSNWYRLISTLSKGAQTVEYKMHDSTLPQNYQKDIRNWTNLVKTLPKGHRTWDTTMRYYLKTTKRTSYRPLTTAHGHQHYQK